VSKIVKNNLDMDSKSYTDLSPKMKEAVSDIFKLIKREQNNVIETFENAVTKVSEFHNINIEEINKYFDNELNEQLSS
tara:strand:+ start:1061 stop:1294 length:234 start_codon:yes stop_codon:yes gene_type:complete